MLKKLQSAPDPLDELCSCRQLTPSGTDWFKRAVDPFHDYELPNLQGYPDGHVEPSLLYTVNRQFNLTKPETLSEGSNWDAHIALLPVDMHSGAATGVFLFPRGSNTGSTGAGVLLKDETAANKRSCASLQGLCMWTGPTGDETFKASALDFADANIRVHSLNPTVYLSSDKLPLTYRTIAAGFEVVNTTATIHRQGDVTVYTSDGHGQETSWWAIEREFNGTVSYANGLPAGNIATDGTSQAPVRGPLFKSPPTNIGQAKQTLGARTWQAAEGAYVPARIHTVNEYGSVCKHDWTMITNSTTGTLPSDWSEQGQSWLELGADNATLEDVVTKITPNRQGARRASHISHYDISGAYFTGLSPETTLTVTLRMSLELIPSPSDFSRMSLVRVPPVLDANALALYSEVVRLLPPGVPVNYNAGGKWFKMAIASVREVIGKAIPYLPALEMALLASGRPGAAGIVNATANALRSKTDKRQQASKEVKITVLPGVAPRKDPA